MLTSPSFAPVFGKRGSAGTPPAGLAALREACRAKIHALALGGSQRGTPPFSAWMLERPESPPSACFQENEYEEREASSARCERSDA